MPPTTGSPSTNGHKPPPVYSTRFKILAAVLVTAAIGAFVVAYLSTADSDNGNGAGTGEYVEKLIPARDSQLIQQGSVGIDLAPGWVGQLVIAGNAIPPEELDFYVEPKPSGGTTIPVANAGNLLQFTPGEGKVLETIPIGNTCATATVWPSDTGPEDSRQVTWCFDVI